MPTAAHQYRQLNSSSFLLKLVGIASAGPERKTYRGGAPYACWLRAKAGWDGMDWGHQTETEMAVGYIGLEVV